MGLATFRGKQNSVKVKTWAFLRERYPNWYSARAIYENAGVPLESLLTLLPAGIGGAALEDVSALAGMNTLLPQGASEATGEYKGGTTPDLFCFGYAPLRLESQRNDSRGGEYAW